MHFGKMLRAFVELHYKGKKSDLADHLGITPESLSRLWRTKDIHTKHISGACEFMGIPEETFIRFAANYK